MKNRISFICLLLLFALVSQGLSQEADTVHTEKNMRFSILGGPGYTPDYGFLIGGSALLTFSSNPGDTSLRRSVLPLAFAYMTSGGGSMVLRPQLFLHHDRIRIFGQTSYSNTKDHYYGVGYEKNKSMERDTDSTEYRNKGFRFNPVLLFRFKTTDMFFGGSIDFNQKKMIEPSPGVMADEDFQAQGGDENGLNYTNMGLGANLSYDTRDVLANAYSGMFVELAATYYSSVLGSTNTFGVFNVQYRQFKSLESLGKRKVLAWMLNGRFTAGNVPLTDLSMIGSAFDLRGYYMGQFRDRNAIFGLAEYRHMFNAGDETFFRRMASKLGFAAWAGLGSIDPDFTDWFGVMPNFGAGLRIELQPRMNFRIDFGHDPINGQTLMYFNMTEAF